MTQIGEKKMLRALEKIAENTGRLYREAARIADALEPDVLLVSAESQGGALPELHKVTAYEKTLEAIKTIRDYCGQVPDCHDNCGIKDWCVGERRFFPIEWILEEDVDD